MIQNFMRKDSESGVWNCTECDYSTTCKPDMTNHVEARHIDSSVTCTICGIETKTRKSLKMHMFRRHKNQNY